MKVLHTDQNNPSVIAGEIRKVLSKNENGYYLTFQEHNKKRSARPKIRTCKKRVYFPKIQRHLFDWMELELKSKKSKEDDISFVMRSEKNPNNKHNVITVIIDVDRIHIISSANKFAKSFQKHNVPRPKIAYSLIPIPKTESIAA